MRGDGAVRLKKRNTYAHEAMTTAYYFCTVARAHRRREMRGKRRTAILNFFFTSHVVRSKGCDDNDPIRLNVDRSIVSMYQGWRTFFG